MLCRYSRVPIAKNNDDEVTKEYIIKLKNFFEELEKLITILWVPGNQELCIYFNNAKKRKKIGKIYLKK